MEAMVKREYSLPAHEMMVMENVPVKLVETVLPFERVAEVPALMSDHLT